ncbi:MAG: hypothetical protein M3016_05220 [Actinomycetota bacterium]|nr:hypothetical protein [Actinomycetota bacterium]
MKQYLFHRSSRIFGAATAALILTALSAAPAQAALVATSPCDNSVLTQPFAQWGDTALYKLVPGGSFEGSLSGWTLTGGARAVAGSEPFNVTGSGGSSSLYLPAGASAQSPFTCVNAAYPMSRFVGRNDGLLSTVVVQVVYKVPLLGQVALPVGTVALSGSWQPTLPMPTASAIPGLLSGGTTQVALRFTALTRTSQIDDVFVDPRMHY